MSTKRLPAFFIYIAILVITSTTSCKKSNETDLFVQLEEFAQIPDFSYAGYRHGNEKPNLFPDSLPTFWVTDFGALPNDGKDDIDAIQKAVDAAGEAGGGIVRFPQGVFDFDVNTAKRFVQIKYSNVKVIGAGEGIDGTTLYDHSPSTYPDESKKWLAGLYPSFFYISTVDHELQYVPMDDSNNALTLLHSAPFESMQAIANEPEKIRLGQTCLLTLENTDGELLNSLVGSTKKPGKNLVSNDGNHKYKFQQMLTITDIKDSTLFFDAPVLWELKENYKPTLWKLPEMVREVAIAGFHLETGWSEKFYHHLNSIHDNGYNHIRITYAENCWVQSIIHTGTSGAVSQSNNKNCSVFHCQIEGNPGHGGFTQSGFATRNLIYNCKGATQMHTYAIQAHVSGSVTFNCHMGEPAAIDCHGGLGPYNLYDNMFGGTFKHGGAVANTPPAIGPHLIIWNWAIGYSEPYKGRVKPELLNTNDVPGFIGIGIRGMYGQPVFIESGNEVFSHDSIAYNQFFISGLNEIPKEQSLFLKQYSKRTGNMFDF